MTNAIAMNVLDTAQLDPGYVCELVERFDMAQVTVIEATHPKEAWATAKEIQRRRGGKTDIFYRRWREKLADEKMVTNTTPEEFVRYMQDVMEAGFVASVYNEAQQSPMTPLTLYSVGVIERTAPRGWRTVHFKTATGTPIGYHGEQPDGYAESDSLLRLAIEMNTAPMNRGDKPLVHFAPHAYFSTQGGVGGHTDRPLELVRRVIQLHLDPRYLPISIGETGLIEMTVKGKITDAHGGWRKVMNNAAAYANVYGAVASQWAKLGIVSHLYGVGDQQTENNVPGQWYNFNLARVTAFWDALELLMKDGRFQIVQSKPAPVDPPPVVVKPPGQFIPKPEKATRPREYIVESFRNIRSGPSVKYRDDGNLEPGDIVTVFEEPSTPEIDSDGLTYIWQWVESEKGNGWVRRTGWSLKRVTPPTVEVPTTPPQPPPAPETPPAPMPTPETPQNPPERPFIELNREFIAEMQRHHQAIAEMWGRLLTGAAAG